MTGTLKWSLGFSEPPIASSSKCLPGMIPSGFEWFWRIQVLIPARNGRLECYNGWWRKPNKCRQLSFPFQPEDVPWMAKLALKAGFLSSLSCMNWLSLSGSSSGWTVRCSWLWPWNQMELTNANSVFLSLRNGDYISVNLISQRWLLSWCLAVKCTCVSLYVQYTCNRCIAYYIIWLHKAWNAIVLYRL